MQWSLFWSIVDTLLLSAVGVSLRSYRIQLSQLSPWLLFSPHKLVSVPCIVPLSAHTGEALWEPSALGYTKSDGLLVLANGEIIEDPAKASQVRVSWMC
jgi:hypothetical protein